jgi:hypothetical protein
MLYNHSKDVDKSNGVWKFQNARSIQNNAGFCEQGKKINVPSSRKIKPIQNPALKLKTPIAYQRDSDPNMLPIEKEGRGKNILCIFFFFLLCNVLSIYLFLIIIRV